MSDDEGTILEQLGSMSDEEGSPLEQPSSPEEEQEDLTTETNGDQEEECEVQEEECENADQETGSRKRSLSTSEDKNDDSPSIKVAKEEISLAIICDSHAKALEKIKQTETALVFHLKVKVTEDLSLATIPAAVEEVLSDDPETKCVVILLPQDDLRVSSIPQSCKENRCSGKGLQHILPQPVTYLTTYMDTLKKTRDYLLNTYPDTDFFWVTPGPVDFRHLNRIQIVNKDRKEKEYEKNHGHYTMTEFMWKTITANYNKRLKVLNDEIPGNMTINWFTRSCWQNRDNRGKKDGSRGGAERSDDSIQLVLQGDLSPIKATGLIEEGENLTVKGGQAMWMIIRKKINWRRKAQAKAKAETEKEEDPSGNTEDDHNEEEMNGKAEDSHTENEVNESQMKKLGGSSVKTTIIGDSWIQILSEIERWQPDPKNRKNVKVYPELSLDSVIEKVDEVLSEETDTENLVLSVFQNHVSSGLSASYVENEFIPCAYSTVDDLLEKASNISKYIKKTYPKVKVFWVSPGPVGYYKEEDKEEQEEEKKKNDPKEQKKKEETKVKEDKAVDEEKDEDDEDEEKDEDDEDEEKDENDEDKEKDENDEDKEKDKNDEEKEANDEKAGEEAEEEEKEEDPEIRKLRRACSNCNSIAMMLSKRLHFRFKKQVVDWFDCSGRTGKPYDPEIEGKILEGKIVNYGYLEEDFINLSETGGHKLMKLIVTTLSGEKPRYKESGDHGSPGINRRGSWRGRGRGSDSGSVRGRGRGGGSRNDSSMGRRPIDNRLSLDGRSSGQRNSWGQQSGGNWGQQAGGNWKGQNRRFQGQDMRDIINRERATNYQRGDDWGGSSQYVDPWARYNYSGYYDRRY